MSDIFELEFDTLEVIAASVAAYEINQGYTKTSDFDYLTNSPLPELKKFPNKELVRSYFGIDHYSADTPRPPTITITAAHRAQAEEIRNYSKKNIFKVLSKKPIDQSAILAVTSTYDEDLYQILQQEKVKVTAFGFIASAPLYYENSKIKDYAKEQINSINSSHVGTIGGKVSLNNFHIIRNTKSKKFEGHIIQGICEGNLFLYFSSRPVDHIKVGDTIHIDGKVKEHVMEQNTIPMTKLNYVVERNNNANITKTPIIRIDSDCDLFG